MRVFDRVADIIVANMGVDRTQIRPDTSILHDLGADSLDVVELAMAIEEAFNLEIPDAQMDRVDTVGDIVTGLERLLHEQE